MVSWHWFDPIEAGLRIGARELLQAARIELDGACPLTRYARGVTAGALAKRRCYAPAQSPVLR
jgi:hypothetical protein